MRVAHVITDLALGGAERMLVKLLAAGAVEEERLVMCLGGRGVLSEEVERLGIGLVTLGMERGRPRPAALVAAVRALRAFRPDVVQSWMYHADLLATLAWPLVGRPALAWNLRCADMDLKRYAQMTRWVRATLARLSVVPAVVVCNSEASRQAHESYGYTPRRWAMIGNGFDTQRFRPCDNARAALRRRLGLPAGTPLIGMIARVDPAKDHQTLLDAAKQLCTHHPTVHFLLVGSRVPSLARALRARGLERRVTCEDARDDIAGLTAGLDLAVLSSAFGESFPNVIGEAMACAVPCVSTDVGDVSNLLSGNGLVVPRHDPTALAAALSEALAWSPQERARRGAAARARIEADFALPAIAAQYHKLYCDLAGRCAA